MAACCPRCKVLPCLCLQARRLVTSLLFVRCAQLNRRCRALRGPARCKVLPCPGCCCKPNGWSPVCCLCGVSNLTAGVVHRAAQRGARCHRQAFGHHLCPGKCLYCRRCNIFERFGCRPPPLSGQAGGKLQVLLGMLPRMRCTTLQHLSTHLAVGGSRGPLGAGSWSARCAALCS